MSALIQFYGLHAKHTDTCLHAYGFVLTYTDACTHALPMWIFINLLRPSRNRNHNAGHHLACCVAFVALLCCVIVLPPPHVFNNQWWRVRVHWFVYIYMRIMFNILFTRVGGRCCFHSLLAVWLGPPWSKTRALCKSSIEIRRAAPPLNPKCNHIE